MPSGWATWWLWGLAALLCALSAQAANRVSVAVVSLEGDPRHAPRRIERAYLGHPGGRAIDGARLAAEDSAHELHVAGIQLVLREEGIASREDVPRLLAALRAAKVQHIVTDVPADVLTALVTALPESLGEAIVFNTAAEEDDLRGAFCAPQLFHTYPSRAMLADALAQYLASQQWRRALVLHGESAADARWQAAFERATRRFGLKATSTRPFRLTADPRQREFANVRLLTARDRDHDVVAVLDSDGEFARGVPYATQLPRPVVGAAGLAALAWHPQWERYGAPQLTRRFMRLARRPMLGQDWAAWMAVRAIVQALIEQPKASLEQQRQALRSGAIGFDGFKGRALSFRPWDGQLRQPVFLGSSEGITAVAPVEGVLHPTEVLDTLGVDSQESLCRRR